jgi:hypothetical protein
MGPYWIDSNRYLTASGIELKSLDLEIARKWGAERCRGGAMLMITKENYFRVGGFDERFNGWGYEDNAFFLLANTILGEFVETDNIAYHLWHPSSINQYPALTLRNRDLYTEYFKHYEEGDLVEWVKKPAACEITAQIGCPIENANTAAGPSSFALHRAAQLSMEDFKPICDRIPEHWISTFGDVRAVRIGRSDMLEYASKKTQISCSRPLTGLIKQNTTG